MDTNGSRHVDTVVLSAFGMESTARVTGLTVSQLTRWDREGWFHPSFADTNRRRPHGRMYSFADLVNLRTVRALIERGMSPKRVRTAWTYLQSLGISEISAAKLYVYAGDVYVHHHDALVAASRGGQSAMPAAVALAPIVAEVEARVQGLSERMPNEIGSTERSRYVVNGEEVFAGTRIPVTMIAAHLRNGWPRLEIFKEYPRLRDADIDLAEEYARTPVPVAS